MAQPVPPLGVGGQATVREHRRPDGTLVARKTFARLDQCQQEVAALRQLQHNSIIKLVVSPTPIVLIFILPIVLILIYLYLSRSFLATVPKRKFHRPGPHGVRPLEAMPPSRPD